MNKHDYDWDGDFECLGNGQYVINQDGRELEPYEVIDLLRQYDDLLEQVNARQYIEVGIDAISSEDMPSTRMAKWWNEYADEAGNGYLLRPGGTDTGASN